IPKKRKALEIVASLMFAALRNNDNTGIFLFTDKIEKFIPARKGRKHVFQILSSIISFKPKSKTTDVKTTLIQVSQILKKRCILFIISDFFDSNDYVKPLKILRGKHDVIILKISDLREQEIPKIGLIELEDEETGEQILVNTSDPVFQKKYTQIVSNNESQMISNLIKLKIDFIKILSDENYAIPLRKFFKKRIRR
ncbi:MAG TPA: VWA domain-containing protein, partial [Nitrososphaeraceae archaeon]|nr:VWA domain-containing protein [Nitrososphaeraceae archaeon]